MSKGKRSLRQLRALQNLLLLGLVCVACGAGSPTPADETAYGLADLMADLEAKGGTVTVDPQSTDHGFQTPGKRIEVDGAAFFVYEFADHQAMGQAASGVSADRGSITITRLEEDGSRSWIHGDCIGTPYLFKKGTLIVLIFDHDPVYDHARARRMLRSVLGPHFAGGWWAFVSE